MYLHIEKLTPLAAEYFANSGGYVADFFLYCKEKVLIIFVILLTAAENNFGCRQ